MNYTASPSAIDLTTVSLVHGYTNVKSAGDDDSIQLCVTAASAEFLWRTGRGPQDGSYPTASPFVSPQSYDELYDGPGGQQLYLRNIPIATVSVLQVFGQDVPAGGTSGYIISGDRKSLVIQGTTRGVGNLYGQGWRAGMLRGVGAYCFASGLSNVHVVYTAGFQAVPVDIVAKVTQWVAVNYKRQSWIDLASMTLSAGGGASGTTRYRDWVMPPEVQAVIEHYKRRAIS
jgi:hypothetical protein